MTLFYSLLIVLDGGVSMKKTQKTVFGLLLILYVPFLYAQSDIQKGRVNMQGEILESACTIDVNSLDQTIDMGNIPASSIRNNNENNTKEFEIKLIDCRWGTETQNNLQSIDISFTGLSENNYFLLDGEAQGIYLELISSTGNKILPGKTIAFEHDFSREALAKYRFKLLADGQPLKPGSFHAIVHFNISYK